VLAHPSITWSLEGAFYLLFHDFYSPSIITQTSSSPCFVANLWDVTDKDIDRLSDNVFTKLRLNESAVRSWSPLLPAPPTSSSTGINGGTVGHRRTGSRVQLVSPTKSRSVVSRIPSDESASSAGFTGPVTRLIRGEPAENDEGKIGPISIVSAVAQSRDSCKLPYLTGAAPVVYGIPFYL
jgi:separase